MNPFMIAGAVAGGIKGLVNIFDGISMRKQAKKIKPDYYSLNDPRLAGQESQYAKQMLGRAQMQVNARMAGAAQRDRQIQTGLAGTQAAIARGVVDPTMAMQSMLASQAQAGQQMDNAAMMDAQFQQQKEANLVNAQNTMIGERDKLYQEKTNKYQMDMSQKNALRNAGQAAISSGIGSIAGSLTGFGANKQALDQQDMQNNFLSQMYGGGSGSAGAGFTPGQLGLGYTPKGLGSRFSNMSNPYK